MVYLYSFHLVYGTLSFLLANCMFSFYCIQYVLFILHTVCSLFFLYEVCSCIFSRMDMVCVFFLSHTYVFLRFCIFVLHFLPHTVGSFFFWHTLYVIQYSLFFSHTICFLRDGYAMAYFSTNLKGVLSADKTPDYPTQPTSFTLHVSPHIFHPTCFTLFSYHCYQFRVSSV